MPPPGPTLSQFLDGKLRLGKGSIEGRVGGWWSRGAVELEPSRLGSMTSVPRNLRDTYLPAKAAAGFWEKQRKRENIFRGQ